MKVAITDANIIFDLFEMDLFETFLSLNYDYITSDFVLNEIKDENLKLKINSFQSKHLISIESLDTEQLEAALKIRKEQPGLSIPDCSVIVLAQKHNALILSGDKVLRNKACHFRLECKGILWVIDILVACNKITKDIARIKLSSLMKVNKRLPVSECNKRLEKWSY